MVVVLGIIAVLSILFAIWKGSARLLEVFIGIVKFFWCLYVLAAIAVPVIVWIKTDWIGAAFVAIPMMIPVLIVESRNNPGPYTQKEWDNASPYAPGSRHVNPHTGKPWGAE